MNLTVTNMIPGFADGNYHIKAPGCIAASLNWANENGVLPDWQPFAYLPIASNGVGMFCFSGGRAVPAEATRVLARTVSADFSSICEIPAPIPKPVDFAADAPMQRFLVMTDLHLSRKPWQVRRALSMGRGYDAVLITGDMTNDGTQEQLERFRQCVDEVIPDIPVFTVTGNHDFPKNPLPRIQCGICDYPALQCSLLARAEDLGVSCHQDVSGAYVATMGDTEIIGLNAASHWRRFTFPDNAQLEWLSEHLSRSRAKRHIILCHAPLRLHRPYLQEDGQCYLSRDSVLQRILDAAQTQIIFLSGHTHISMNCHIGCAEMAEGNHLYINCGSIRPTDLKRDEILQPECWTDGNVVELVIGENQTTVTGISTKTGQKIPRAYYRF